MKIHSEIKHELLCIFFVCKYQRYIYPDMKIKHFGRLTSSEKSILCFLFYVNCVIESLNKQLTSNVLTLKEENFAHCRIFKGLKKGISSSNNIKTSSLCLENPRYR